MGNCGENKYATGSDSSKYVYAKNILKYIYMFIVYVKYKPINNYEYFSGNNNIYISLTIYEKQQQICLLFITQYVMHTICNKYVAIL